MSLALVRYDGKAIALTAEATALKESALAKSGIIGRVSNAEENAVAVEAQTELRRVQKLAEAARVEAKAPYLDVCRQIDAAAKEFNADLEEELRRVARLVSDFQSAELERQREEQRRAAEAQAKIEEARRQEQAKIEAEAAAKAAAAKSEGERKRIEEEAAKAKLVSEERRQQELIAAAPRQVQAKSAGQVVREVWRFEVANIWDLVKARPDLVSIEVRKSAVNEAITVLASTGEPKIPGLRIWKEVESGVRVGRQAKAIEV